jgi:hypothetical protein
MIVEPSGTNPAVTGAIRQAARMTGADFRYLLATAQVESNLNPNAQAQTSTAKGLFQFTEQTWLTTLKEQGTPLGYAPYANAISRQPSGDYAVSDPQMSDSIMNLRADPAANSLMAGAFTKANTNKLAGRLGRTPTEGELYIAHFLGATGASRLISLADASPQTPAASVFPGAARANPTIFYDSRGQARSANDVYRVLVGRYDAARGSAPSTPTMTAGATAAPSSPAPVSAAKAFAPDTAAVTETYAAAAKLSSQAVDNGPVFHGLFRSSGTSEPISPLVQALWSTPPADMPPSSASASPPALIPPPVVSTPPTVAATAAPPQPAGGELGLFQDQLPDARALFRGRV